MTPTTPDEDSEIARGQRAAELLDDPLLREAFTRMRERFTAELFDAPMRDKEGREQLWLMRKCLDAVEGQLQTVMQTGRMAMISRVQARTARQKLGDWIGGE